LALFQDYRNRIRSAARRSRCRERVILSLEEMVIALELKFQKMV